MLYTSYIAKLNKLPEKIVKVSITRYSSKHIDMKKYKNLYLMKELAPSKKLLLTYKQNNDWDYYTKQFTYEMENRIDMKNKINSLLKYLQSGKDVILICFKKDYLHCHRYLLAQYFVNKEIKWKEINI